MKKNTPLNVYKVTFVKNKVDSCKVVSDTAAGDNDAYEEYKGQLIYALIKAENESGAREKAEEIANVFLSASNAEV